MTTGAPLELKKTVNLPQTGFAQKAARRTQLFLVREMVHGKLEEARVAKLLGGSLEARVVFSLPADGEMLPLLRSDANDLRCLFIVSQVELRASAEPHDKNLSLKIDRADGEKRERCRNYSTRVGASARYPTACERGDAALAEIEREGDAA